VQGFVALQPFGVIGVGADAHLPLQALRPGDDAQKDGFTGGAAGRSHFSVALFGRFVTNGHAALLRNRQGCLLGSAFASGGFGGGLSGGGGLLGALLGAFLGLLARFGLLRVVAGRALGEAGGVEEAQHAVGRLSAL